MSRKSFYLIVGIVLILMVGYFSYQMHSSSQTYCHPSMTSECMGALEQLCAMYGGGANIGFVASSTWCDGPYCWGLWKVVCENYMGNLLMFCSDDGSYQCWGN